MSNQRLITAPVRLTGAVHPQQISSLLAVDVLARRSAARGGPTARIELNTIAGDAATQQAVRRAVLREGEDRDELGRVRFAERAGRLEGDAFDELSRLLEALQLRGHLDWSVANDLPGRAARVAFVRLFEDGLLTRTDAVLDSCSTCETVVDAADVDSNESEVELIRVGLLLENGTLEIDVAEPELILGAVAVAVPLDSVPDDAFVYTPLVDRELPVVPVTGLTRPALVIPGHYQWCYEIARQLDLPIVEVTDADGVVRQSGSLDGMNRFAARAAATEALVNENFVTAHFTDMQTTRRCHRCGSVLAALRGSHWILSFRDLVGPVVDALDAGTIALSPVDASQILHDAASRTDAWVVSQQLWAGQPIPVYSCLDCGQTTVAVDMADSCPSCMGTLAQETDTLDARFIAAIAPLAMLGWPQDLDEVAAGSTTLTVGRSGLDNWALPMAAFGLRLAKHSPFSRILVHRFAIGAPEPGQRQTTDFVDQVGEIGSRVARAGLLLGDLDVDRAFEVVRLLDAPNVGDVDVDDLVGSYDKAIASLDAGDALAILVAAAREGVTPRSRTILFELVRPLLGD